MLVMSKEIIIAIIGSGALAALISGVFGLIKDRRVKNTATGTALQQLMYDRIKYLCKAHLSRGQIASNDLEDLIKMHEAYHKLGGNGFLDELMDSVMRLKIVPACMFDDKRSDKDVKLESRSMDK